MVKYEHFNNLLLYVYLFQFYSDYTNHVWKYNITTKQWEDKTSRGPPVGRRINLWHNNTYLWAYGFGVSQGFFSFFILFLRFFNVSY